MSEIMLICLYVLGGLSVLFLTFIAVRVGKNFYKAKNVKPVSEDIVKIPDEDEEETILGEPEEPEITDYNVNAIVKDEVVAVTEPVVEEDVNEEKTEKEEDDIVETTVEENVIIISDIEDDTDEMADKLNIKRVHFAQKLLSLDENAIDYYDQIYNKFNSYRGVSARISFKHVTFRYKRKLISKLTVKGKTVKLHLALDSEAFNKNVYFQTDLSNIKAYEEVPFTVKVKSARGLKNALYLVELLCEKEGVEPKSRYKKVDASKLLVEVMGIK